MTACTFRGCPNPATKRLQQSIGGRPWYGCPTHTPAMEKVLNVGMPGATTGTAWVTVTNLAGASA